MIAGKTHALRSTTVSGLISTVVSLSLLWLTGCTDQGKPLQPTAPQTVHDLTVGLDSVVTFPQDTVQLTISGGVSPYAFVGNLPSILAGSGIADSTLTIRSTSNGSAILSIVDASIPAHQIDLPVHVRTAVSFSSNVQPIFTGSYGCVGCHGGTQGLFLTNATVSYQNLVNVPAQSAGYPGYMRVAPRNLAKSLLYVRLSSNDPSVSMPQGRSTPFDGTDLEYVRTWILQGAHFN